MRIESLKIIVMLFIGLNCSCSNPNDNKQTPLKSEDLVQENTNHQAENKLVLDNGKRWKANKETTEGVDRMIELLASFSDENGIESYAKLTHSLETEFTTIFQKCTMKGEAHHQLHNFLIPINQLFKTLASKELKECEESLQQLSKHLEEYDKYFES